MSTQPIQKVPGDDVTTKDNTKSAVAAYQTASAHGNAVVSDATTPTIIKYGPGKAILSRANNKDTGIVHLPIPNPPQLSTALNLQSLLINFDTSENDTTITKVVLYYDDKEIFSQATDESTTFHLDTQGTEPTLFAYVVPSGISVELDLKFRNSSSTVTLRSVTLVYKAA